MWLEVCYAPEQCYRPVYFPEEYNLEAQTFLIAFWLIFALEAAIRSYRDIIPDKELRVRKYTVPCRWHAKTSPPTFSVTVMLYVIIAMISRMPVLRVVLELHHRLDTLWGGFSVLFTSPRPAFLRWDLGNIMLHPNINIKHSRATFEPGSKRLLLLRV